MQRAWKMGRRLWLGCPQCSHIWVPASTNGSPLTALDPPDPPTTSCIFPLFFLQIREAQEPLPFPSLQRGPRNHYRGSHQDRQSIEEVDDHTGMGWVWMKGLLRAVLA